MEETPWMETEQEKRNSKFSLKLLYIFIAIICTVFISLYFVSTYFNNKYTYVTINGKSMQPTLNPTPSYITVDLGDGYHTQNTVQDGVYMQSTDDIDYNDIIIIENVFQDKTIIKRVLAFGGDYVTIAKVEIEPSMYEYRYMRVVNGSEDVEVLEEDYIKSHYEWVNIHYVRPDGAQNPLTPEIIYEPEFYKTFGKTYDTKTFYVDEVEAEVMFYEVPEGHIFYMGDNRTNSSDSRSLGTTNADNILGKVVYIVRNGARYQGNYFWMFHRTKGFIVLLWRDFLGIFGI